MKVADGDRLRLKKTLLLKEFGVRCYSPLADADCKIWPGDIGTVETYRGNGWDGMKLVFSRGRTKQIGTRYQGEDWTMDDDVLEDFTKLRKSV